MTDLDTLPAAPHCAHVPASAFAAGQPIDVKLSITPASNVTGHLHYRSVNQADHYHVVEMARSGATYRTIIPADYTNSPYALEYFFELRNQSGQAWLYPGSNATLDNQPYYVVEQRE